MSDIADRLEAFINAAQEGESGEVVNVTGAPLYLADLEMVVAIIRASEDNEATALTTFVLAAERGIKGWANAHKNQIAIIGRLSQKLTNIRKILDDSTGEISGTEARMTKARIRGEIDA